MTRGAGSTAFTAAAYEQRPPPAPVVVAGQIVGYASDFVPVSVYRLTAPAPSSTPENRHERRRREALARRNHP